MQHKHEEDPFLCDKCQPLGYCKAARERSKIEELRHRLNLSKMKKDIPLTEREVSHWVPLRTMIKDANTSFGIKLQHAHELFHQDEFEQASYMYLDMLETRNDCEEVKIGLAAALYFLHQYEQAASAALKISSIFKRDWPMRLAHLCEIKLYEQWSELNNPAALDLEINNSISFNKTTCSTPVIV